tara:strand:+ start:1000 stop:1224 length:225 start_codon:yes stop_codon:yes gene_type:complete
MLEKLKDLEQQLMDELEPEVYEKVKYIVDKYDLTGHERNLYKCGYLDGLQAAIVIASDNATHGYTLNLDDIFNE